MRGFVVRLAAGTAKWFIFCTVAGFAMHSVLDAPAGLPTLKAGLLAILATVGGVAIAFRLERALLSQLPNEDMLAEEADV